MNKEEIIKQSKDFKTLKEFREKLPAAYKKAWRLGILDSLGLELKISKPCRYSDKELFEEGGKYKTKLEFRKSNRNAYQQAYNRGLLQKINLKNSGTHFKRLVYAYLFSDDAVYVGLTYNIKLRDDLHNQKGGVFNYKNKTGITPSLVLLTDILPAETAAKKEGDFIEFFKKKGYKILNKAKPGGLGGNHTNWTFEKVKAEALKYKTKKDFRVNSQGAYLVANRRGWMINFTHLSGSKPNGYWTNERLTQEAGKFKTKGEFYKKSNSAYQTALRKGLINSITHFN